MLNNPKLQFIFILSLALLLISTGCSKENQSAEESATVKAQAAPGNSHSKPTGPVDFKTSYTEAAAFMKAKDYASARENLLLAVADNNQEQRVVKFFRRHDAYLPHFYLGQIAYLTGDCEEAITQWDISLAQNVIQTTIQFNELKRSRQKCESEN